MDVLERIRICTVCEAHLPSGPRPVVQLDRSSRILIIGQAPGRKVHETGIPWNDASGKTLRMWLGVDENTFYNRANFSIMPMGFCYPGKGKSGDLPPRPECAVQWHSEILNQFDNQPLILLIGQYAQRYYLKKDYQGGLAETVRNYDRFLPHYFPLPHPSPRNQYWVQQNRWFAETVIPALKREVEKRLRNAEQPSL